MGQKKTWITPLLAGIGTLILILDSQTAIHAAANALELCIRVVIPSLFPLFVFSMLLTGSLEGSNILLLRPLGKIVHLSRERDAFLLTGFLSGYPAGAQCVAQGYKSGRFPAKDAERMLSFCSNAGPSFIFGITSSLFSSKLAPWLLWGIQILSALFAGFLLNTEHPAFSVPAARRSITLTQSLQKSIRAIVSVCGWILLFRCLIAYLEKFLFPMLPGTAQAILTGLLELTNGCWFLQNIQNEQLRFILCAVFLAFGSICVVMQTQAVTNGLSLRAYVLGKLFQAFIAAVLSVGISCLLFPESSFLLVVPSLLFLCGTVFVGTYKFGWKKKKSSRFSRHLSV